MQQKDINVYLTFRESSRSHSAYLQHYCHRQCFNTLILQCMLRNRLFLICMNDIQYAVLNAKSRLFTDETNLFLHNSDPANILATTNVSMSQLSEWFTVNRFSLNLNKTCYSIFGPNHKVSTGFHLYINGQEVQKTESCKYLGIIIDCNLKWRDHTSYVYNKLIKFVSIFFIKLEAN